MGAYVMYIWYMYKWVGWIRFELERVGSDWNWSRTQPGLGLFGTMQARCQVLANASPMPDSGYGHNFT